MRILLAEDDSKYAKLLQRYLTGEGRQVDWVSDGEKALEKLRLIKYDILITDWMMPELDGIGLIRCLRKEIKPIPLIMMLTSISDPKGKAFALQSGADDFSSKTISRAELISRLNELVARMKQELPVLSRVVPKPVSVRPPFVGVVIASSTGGPQVLTSIFQELPKTLSAAVFVVQHGPPWMLDNFSQRLKATSGFNIELAKDGTVPTQGKGYLSPGDKHMCLGEKPLSININQGPKENHVRPAADPLFRSAVKVFGEHCIAVILTGLGRDGAAGASEIKNAGGVVLVEDPQTATAPFMPRTVMELGLEDEIWSFEKMAAAITENVRKKSAVLANGQ